MQTTKKKPLLIFILVGAVLAGYLGYLINGAWTEGIEQERYLTITIERKNFEEAKAQFATLEATIHKIPLSIMQKKH